MHKILRIAYFAYSFQLRSLNAIGQQPQCHIPRNIEFQPAASKSHTCFGFIIVDIPGIEDVLLFWG
jgi:hypothetical protein